jgi:hypothetical protein
MFTRDEVAVIRAGPGAFPTEVLRRSMFTRGTSQVFATFRR